MAREQGLSLLDWLWVNYGLYEISDTVTSGTIPTSDAILTLVDSVEGNVVATLKYRDHPSDSTLKLIIGLNSDGEEITSINVPTEVYLSSASARLTTSEDEGYDLHTTVLSLIMSDGTEYLVSSADLGVIDYTSKDTTTIVTDITDGVISSEVVVAPASDTISLTKTNAGLLAKLILADESEVTLETDGGLSASIPWQDSSLTVKFKSLTLSEYLVEDVEDGVVYFITSYPYIYLNGVKYGINREGLLSNAKFDESTGILSFTEVESGDTITIELTSDTYVQYLAEALISEEEDNMLILDENNKLYAPISTVSNLIEESLNWITI